MGSNRKRLAVFDWEVGAVLDVSLPSAMVLECDDNIAAVAKYIGNTDGDAN